MNGDAADISVLNEKMSSLDDRFAKLIDYLDNNAEAQENKEDYAEKINADGKQERNKFRRQYNKQKLYQASPVVIDGITQDGKNQLQKSLKNLFEFPKETKKAMDVKKESILGPLALIAGLLLGAYTFFKDKIDEIFKTINSLLSFGKISELVLGFLETFKLKLLEALSKFLDTEKLVSIFKSEELVGLAKRFAAIPRKYLLMSAEELSKATKEFERFIKTQQVYYGHAMAGDTKLLKDLEALQKLRQSGMTTKEIMKLVAETNKSTTFFENTIKTFEPFTKTITGFGKGVYSLLEGLVKISAAFIKLIPGGTQILELGESILKNLGPLAVLFDAFEAGIHMFDKAKAGQLGAKEITTALLTLFLRAVGWLGSAIFFPLAFLRRESIEKNIKDIFEETDLVNKILKMLAFPFEVIIKSIGETLKFLISGIPFAAKMSRKIVEFFTGKQQEKGIIENFFDGFVEEFSKQIEDFSLTKMGEKFGEFVYDLISQTLQWARENISLKGISSFVLDKLGFKKSETPKIEPQTYNDFVSRPGQKPMKFSSNDTIIGLKDPSSLSKPFVEVVKKMQEDRREDRRVLVQLSEAINKLSEAQKNNLSLINNSKNSTNITISPTTSKSFRDSRYS